MKLSRTVEYAIQAVVLLAGYPQGTTVPCSRLAADGQMPERFLLQILRNLVTHGILASTRGVEGGYALERPVDQVSLLDIIEAIDGPLGGEDREAGENRPETHRRLNNALKEVTQLMRRELSNVKLSSLLPPPASRTHTG
jgi:Rrf2 family protein